MHDFNVRMIKILMVFMVFSVILIMTSGMSILKNNYYWRGSYFSMQWEYLETELAYFDYNYGNIFSWMAYRGESDSQNQQTSFKQASSVPVLLYHGIINDPNWKPDGVNMTVNEFRDQMFALKKAGYKTITVEDYEAFINGKKALPEKSFMLTFDDGRKDSYYHAEPVLRTVGYLAVMNVITNRSLGTGNGNGTFHLSKIELEKMIESGHWEMESHGKDDHDYVVIAQDGTKGHYLTNKLWLPAENRMETEEEFRVRVTNDLVNSKRDIEKNLGVKVSAFAYPFGDFGQEVVNFPQSEEIVSAIAQSIYPVTFTQTGSGEIPMNYAKDKDASVVKRISSDSSISAKDLVSLLGTLQDKTIPYKDNFQQNQGWLQGWGSIEVKNSSLSIGSDNVDDSSLTFLGGSYLWDNYYAHMTARVKNGNAFAIGGRYRNGNNYLSCNYYDGRVVFAQEINKQEMPEVEVPTAVNVSSGRAMNIGISIKGDGASCFLDGRSIISAKIDPGLKYGGISFKIWDSIQKGARLQLSNLVVEKNL